MTTTPSLWKSSTQANTTAAGNQFDGQVVALPDGGYLVVWDDSSHTTHNPMGDSIVEQRYDAAGNKVGGEGDLNPSFAGSDSEPAITLLPNGNVALAFVHTFAGDQDIEVRVFNSSLGLVRTDNIDLSDTFQTFNPSITAFGDGSYLVSYTATPGPPSILGRIVTASGISPFVIDLQAGHSYDFSEVATLSNGNAVAVYQDNDGAQTDIKYGIFTPTGITQVTGPSFVFGGAGAGSETDPHVAALRDGGFVVVWTDPDGPDPTNIRATLYSNDGTADVGFRNVLVNTTTSGPQDTADVTALADGGFLVSWLDRVGFFIRAQRFDAAGHQIGSEFIVSDDHDFASQSLAVEATALSDGRIAYAVDGIPSSLNEDVKTSIFTVDTRSDFNANGLSDILWQGSDGTPALWLMNGTTAVSVGAAGAFDPGPSWHVKHGGDFNGDDRADILWQSDDGTPAIWLMNDSNVLSNSPAGSFNPGPSWQIQGTGDFNGDGRSDILWQGQDGTPAIWLMNGTNTISVGAVGPFNPGPSWQIKATGDFNADGSSDILWQSSDGTPAIWLMNGMNFLSAGVAGSFNPGPGWQIKGTGDFNADGRSDILWQSSDGTPAIWLMNGMNAVTVAAVGPFNPGPSWHVEGTGDYNGDGKSDILWQSDDGTPAIWFMNGTTFLGGAAAGSFDPGHDWHVIA
jgi:hypothetical protein